MNEIACNQSGAVSLKLSVVQTHLSPSRLKSAEVNNNTLLRQPDRNHLNGTHLFAPKQSQFHQGNNNSSNQCSKREDFAKCVEPPTHQQNHSSSGSDISDDLNDTSLKDVAGDHPHCANDDGQGNVEAKEVTKTTRCRRPRSMSDGASILNGFNPDGEPFEVFPSLPDSVLEKLGITGAQTQKDRLHDDELEQKFVSLSLAFTIDATTIKNRSERQRRCRDQTETNLNVEIERLVEKAHRLRPICIDAETTELLTTLLAQVDVIVNAADHAMIAAERYGAVQHEERLADSVQLMISHVHSVKQQRDSARRQLAYTKRVLQDTNTPDGGVHKQRLAGHQARLVTRRRASIATISQPHHEVTSNGSLVGLGPDGRKMTRRTSELTLRGNVLTMRSMRQARLDIGLDLVKIRENILEDHQDIVDEESEDDILDVTPTLTGLIESHEETVHDDELDAGGFQNRVDINPEGRMHISTEEIKNQITHSVRKISRNCGNAITTWLDDSAQGNYFYFSALICFALSIITLGNIFIDIHYARGTFRWFNDT